LLPSLSPRNARVPQQFSPALYVPRLHAAAVIECVPSKHHGDDKLPQQVGLCGMIDDRQSSADSWRLLDPTVACLAEATALAGGRPPRRSTFRLFIARLMKSVPI
jgi:hypothetical protein